MSNPIILPPIPAPVGKVLYAGPYHQIRETEGAFDADQLRARDLEVARTVLEAAAQATEGYWDGRQERLWAETCAAEIRTLEFRHG